VRGHHCALTVKCFDTFVSTNYISDAIRVIHNVDNEIAHVESGVFQIVEPQLDDLEAQVLHALLCQDHSVGEEVEVLDVVLFKGVELPLQKRLEQRCLALAVDMADCREQPLGRGIRALIHGSHPICKFELRSGPGKIIRHSPSGLPIGIKIA
jgi:hypothetical protein